MKKIDINSTSRLPMGLKKRYISYMLSAIILLAWSIPALASSSIESLMKDFGVQQPRTHKPAPDFTLHNLNGTQASLSDFRGQVVLLHFWATWCVPCRHEMPLLHSLDRQEINGFHIICVNVDRNDRKAVQSFVDEVTPQFNTLLDPEGSVRNRYAVRGLPSTYLIARDGKIIGRIIGERDWASPAAKELMQLLSNKDKN